MQAVLQFVNIDIDNHSRQASGYLELAVRHYGVRAYLGPHCILVQVWYCQNP